MSQVAIPLAFEGYLQERLLNGLAPDMNEMIFAYLPDLDPEQVIDRHLGLPAPSYWVYRQDITQKAKLNDVAVAYSVVIPSEVEAFTFNAIYLHDKQTANSCGLVVHKIAETKEPGMSSVRTCVQQYTGAARAAKITVTPESWQIDYHARLYGMDDDLRLACFDLFGNASFFADGFLVQSVDGQYVCQAGTGYVAGLRCVNQGQTEITDVLPASGIYLDVSWQGGVVSRWTSNWKLTASTTSLTDYVADGVQHYVTQIAWIESDGRVTDRRHLGLDEHHLPDATTQAKGAVVLASDAQVNAGQGSGMVSPQQLKQAFDQFGTFGSAMDLGVVTEDAQLDAAPTGLLHFSAGSQQEHQGIKIQHPDGYYSVIAGADNHNNPSVFLYHSVSGSWRRMTTDNDIQRSFVGMVADFQIAAPRPGWLNANGGEVSRTTDAILWQYAQDAELIIDQTNKDADPMKYAAYFGDGDGSTTFTLPNFHLGHFRRGAKSGVAHGATQGDAIRNIYGETQAQHAQFLGNLASYDGGAFVSLSNQYEKASAVSGGNSLSLSHFRFDASRVVPTANENRPYTVNISVKIFRGWI
ncbi:phage tail protein [Vibrio gazogenes]|uniref:Phage tail-collar fibre protein n=2 Tax=Vibrio gazogenes TaxID=687 RepID=A0A1M5CA11_VIBGA|nr:phage tail protein [Vibrio gazogenes]SHF51558.1 Phage tail-collar fibre protein [Vibrio gazogenes DSM 21264] [Vibrio gazogenes DSM 21264 = NBRC 103151]SJN55402.1 Tail fiber protein [Vibrio gazogenes]